jgi:hypothetical protein
LTINPRDKKSLEELPLIGFLFEQRSLGERPIVCFLCGLPFVLGFWSIAQVAVFSPFAMIFAVGVLIPGAILWALPIANRIGVFAGDFYTGSERFSTPPPSYSTAEGLVASGCYEQAIQAYAKIAADHPQEITPHLQTMKIWTTKLQNPQAAADAYTTAMTKIRGAQNRKKFDRMARNDYSKHILFG